jgi:hypothetical protein
LKQSGELSLRCRCRTAPYLNNIIEQDHRFIKKRIAASLGFRSADGAWRTIEGYEAMHAIRKGQIRLVGKADPVGQRQFIHTIFGVARVAIRLEATVPAPLPYLQQNRGHHNVSNQALLRTFGRAALSALSTALGFLSITARRVAALLSGTRLPVSQFFTASRLRP